MTARRGVPSGLPPEPRVQGALVEYRVAVPGDAAECVAMRGRTRENAVSVERLAALGITAESWGRDIETGAIPGHVCVSGGAIVGYCFGERASGEVVVLALLPGFEGQGIGRVLLHKVIEDLRATGFRRLFLGCSPDPATRSYGFYRYLGWRSTGEFDAAGDELLEYFPDARATPNAHRNTNAPAPEQAQP